jgi:hypothetical protein
MAVIKIKEGYDVRPEGLYVLQVKEVQVKEAKTGKTAGSPFLSWEDTIIEAPEHEDLIGESYFDITPPGCSPKSKYYKLFASLGYSIPEGKKEMELDTDDLAGKEFVAEIGVAKDGDTERNEFKNIWSVEEFQKHLEKTQAIKSKIIGGSSATVVKSPVVTKTITVQEETVEKASVLQGSAGKLTDFPK